MKAGISTRTKQIVINQFLC